MGVLAAAAVPAEKLNGELRLDELPLLPNANAELVLGAELNTNGFAAGSLMTGAGYDSTEAGEQDTEQP